MKKGIAILCILLVAMTSIFAQAATETGSKAGKPVEITCMVYERGKTMGNGMTTTDNLDTRWINSILEPQGVHVTYIGVPRSGSDNNVNTMIAAGTAPDVIYTYGRERVIQYGVAGGLVDFRPYLDKLDPEYQQLIQGAPLNECTINGGIYALPALFGVFSRGHEQYIRKDIVDALGMEMPKTRDDLIKFLYAVKENYPDMIPYAFGGKVTDSYFFNFILSYTSRANERDNYIYEPSFTIALKPGAKEGYKQLNQFWLDGIIPHDFAIDTDETKYTQSRANGEVAYILYTGNKKEDYTQYGKMEGYELAPISCLPNADGDDIVPSSGAVDRYVYVLKSAEDAGKMDAIMKFLNFLSSRERETELSYRTWSAEASHIDENGVPVANMTGAELQELGYAERTSDLCILWAGLDFGKAAYVAQNVASNPQVPAEFFDAKYDVIHSGYFHRQLIPAALKADQYQALLQSLICEFAFKVISAPEGQFEKVWNDSYKKLVENHLEDVLNERAAWYDANKK